MRKNYYKRDYTLKDYLFFPALIEGLWYTLKLFFSKKYTIQYPEETRTFPEILRGFPYLVWNEEEERERCVACKLCERVCPPQCITIEPDETSESWLTVDVERYPKKFEIDMGTCIVCGFCAEACPVDAIRMSDAFSWANYDRNDLILNKNQLLTPYHDVSRLKGMYKQDPAKRTSVHDRKRREKQTRA
ncbi:NuoI/complex I 23 kDa subunit family protein [Bdellovibrionota bacterium]